MYRELLLGSGYRLQKLIAPNGHAEWTNLVTLDINPDCNPDIIWDLEILPLPFKDNNKFDEIHAYEVLEHTGNLGDYKFFFAQFSEFWRILKPKGLFFGTCPSQKGKWAFGDPGHKRMITAENFIFLSQQQYTQIGKTAMSDYRSCYKADFETIHCIDNGETLEFALRAIK